MAKIPVIIDSEIGPNIDDAFSLAVALCSPEIDLLGVTIASDIDGTATEKAKDLVEAFGANVPVVRGHVSSLKDHKRNTHEAARFLAASVQSRPGEVVVITNGPLTNIAKTIQMYPDFVQNVKCVVSMAGWTGQRLSEWNVRSDPEAMKTVIASGVELYIFGLDVTNACPVNEIHIKLLRESGLKGTHLLLKYLETWRAHNAKPAMLHDPLTVAFVCQPDLAIMEKARVRLERDRGVLAVGGEGHEAYICKHVDVLRYLDFVIDRLTVRRTVPPSISHRFLGVSPGTAIHRFPPPLLYNAIELPYRPGWALENLNRAEHQVIMVRNGNLSLEAEHDTFHGVAGDVFFVPANITHNMHTTSGMRLVIIFFQLNGGLMETEDETDGWFQDLKTRAFQVPQSHTAPFVRVMENLVRSHMEQTVESLLMSKSHLYELLVLLLDSRRASTGVNGLNARQLLYVNEAKRFIEERLTTRFSLIELERAIGISRYYLSRLFQKYYGLSPGAYHTKLRMQRAIELIEFGHLSLAEVADHLGFHSIHSFSRAFKAHTGLSPSAYASKGVAAYRPDRTTGENIPGAHPRQ